MILKYYQNETFGNDINIHISHVNSIVTYYRARSAPHITCLGDDTVDLLRVQAAAPQKRSGAPPPPPRVT